MAGPASRAAAISRHLAPALQPLPSDPLVAERAGATFDATTLASALAGGREALAAKRALDLEMSRDPALSVSLRRHGMGRPEERELSAVAVRRFLELLRADESDETRRTRSFLFALAWPGAHGRASNHLDLFMPCIRALASDAQLARWLPAAESFRMLGCFACTELGHGSFVRGLETTATFIPASASRPACLEVHTPTETAQKCW